MVPYCCQTVLGVVDASVRSPESGGGQAVAVGVVGVPFYSQTILLHARKSPGQVIGVAVDSRRPADRFGLLGDAPQLVAAILHVVQRCSVVDGAVAGRFGEPVVTPRVRNAAQRAARQQAVLRVAAQDEARPPA